MGMRCGMRMKDHSWWPVGVLSAVVCTVISSVSIANPVRPEAYSPWPATNSAKRSTTDINPNDGMLSWTQATPAAAWPAEGWGREFIVFDGKMWLVGGGVPWGSERHDVWCSADGAYWTEVLSEAPWSPRSHHTCVVFAGRLWIIGGKANDTGDDDVWSSEDGVNWTLEVESAPWGPRDTHDSVVFDGKIWIFGGYSKGKWLATSVWNSPDGLTWTQAPVVLPYSERFSPSAMLVFEGKMWIVGGGEGKTVIPYVWNSSDGLTWDFVGSCAPWSSSGAVVFDGGIALVGGWEGGYPRNHVWYSPTGRGWTEVLPRAPWCARSPSAVVVFDDKIWVLGGSSYDPSKAYLSDVWYAKGLDAGFSAAPASDMGQVPVDFTDESTWFAHPIATWQWDFGDGTTSTKQHPNHTYTEPGSYTVSLIVTSESGLEDTETKTDYIVVEREPHPFHSADVDEDGAISLSELLRAVQLYNSGGYQCDPAAEDGYSPAPGGHACAPHDGDYTPQDWELNLVELLRLIQIYNCAGYTACADGEDGFCPGQSRTKDKELGIVSP